MSKRISKIIPSFLVDKASFHCTHWHRFFPLKKVFFYLSVSPARRAPPFSPSLSSIIFTPPSVPPGEPKGREDVAGCAIASARVLVSSAEPLP